MNRLIESDEGGIILGPEWEDVIYEHAYVRVCMCMRVGAVCTCVCAHVYVCMLVRLRVSMRVCATLRTS